MANPRRKGGQSKDAERAKEPAAVDEHWDSPWPLDRQREYPVDAEWLCTARAEAASTRAGKRVPL